MQVLRSPDVRRLCLQLGAAVLLCAGAAWFFAGRAACLAAGITALFFSGICLGHTLWRHREMGRLADYLRRIARGEYALDVRDNEEGELSLLKNEVYKVTAMLAEYNDALRREKRQLADAMADISHQLKTPLTSMLMLTDLLQQEDLPDDKRREFTRHIRLQLERVEWLVSSLLKLARLDAGVAEMHPARTAIAPWIREVVSPLLVPIELKEQTLTLEGSEEACFTGDPRWTAEALTNVLKNCMEHTPRGGRLSITWEENPLYTAIRIADSGEGISPADLPHIFTRFYRGKNAEGAESGVGIGLAMAKSILSRQDGDIAAESRPGEGTVFTIRFHKTVV